MYTSQYSLNAVSQKQQLVVIEQKRNPAFVRLMHQIRCCDGSKIMNRDLVFIYLFDYKGFIKVGSLLAIKCATA